MQISRSFTSVLPCAGDPFTWLAPLLAATPMRANTSKPGATAAAAPPALYAVFIASMSANAGSLTEAKYAFASLLVVLKEQLGALANEGAAGTDVVGVMS